MKEKKEHLVSFSKITALHAQNVELSQEKIALRAKEELDMQFRELKDELNKAH